MGDRWRQVDHISSKCIPENNINPFLGFINKCRDTAELRSIEIKARERIEELQTDDSNTKCV
jgi:hypothetical protein